MNHDTSPKVRKAAPEGTQAVVRAIRLLKSFTRQQPQASLAELCERVGLTKTTAYRLLAALESEDLVAHSSTTHLYRLGPAALALGTRAWHGDDLRSLVEPELKALAERTGETATLELLVDRRVLIFSEHCGTHLVSAAADVGTSWPLHATSTGKVLLAPLPPDQRRELLELPLAEFTPSTITDLAELEREMDRALDRGYATAIEELELDHAAVAVALHDAIGQVVGALSVGGPSRRLDPSRLAELGDELRTIASRLSAQIDPA